MIFEKDRALILQDQLEYIYKHYHLYTRSHFILTLDCSFCLYDKLSIFIPNAERIGSVYYNMRDELQYNSYVDPEAFKRLIHHLYDSIQEAQQKAESDTDKIAQETSEKVIEILKGAGE